MIEDEQGMYRSVRRVLEGWIDHSATLDHVSREITMAAHRQIYGTFMKYIAYFQVKGTCTLLKVLPC
jgi:hypothetical protein